MSGHSKWANIKRKKGRVDAERGKIFTKIGREISISVKNGGSDPDANSKLRDAIAKAKAANMPNDRINNAINKAAGDANLSNFEEITYEGYGPSGVAIIVETMTDNRNRTAGEMRHIFDKYGGNLGATGCVGWMFKEKGVIVIEGDDINEEELLMQAMELGADDVESEESSFEVLTDADDFSNIREEFEKLGYNFSVAETEKIPDNYVSIDDDAKIKLEKLLEKLEENEDVQDVWHNAEGI